MKPLKTDGPREVNKQSPAGTLVHSRGLKDRMRLGLGDETVKTTSHATIESTTRAGRDCINGVTTRVNSLGPQRKAQHMMVLITVQQ